MELGVSEGLREARESVVGLVEFKSLLLIDPKGSQGFTRVHMGTMALEVPRVTTCHGLFKCHGTQSCRRFHEGAGCHALSRPKQK